MPHESIYVDHERVQDPECSLLIPSTIRPVDLKLPPQDTWPCSPADTPTSTPSSRSSPSYFNPSISSLTDHFSTPSSSIALTHPSQTPPADLSASSPFDSSTGDQEQLRCACGYTTSCRRLQNYLRHIETNCRPHPGMPFSCHLGHKQDRKEDHKAHLAKCKPKIGRPTGRKTRPG